MANKKIIFRVDASVSIGTGHVRRCIVIASQLKDLDIKSLFLCRDFDGHLAKFIEESGFECRLLALNSPEPKKDKLSLHQMEDAGETLKHINDDIEAIFIDNYALNVEFEGEIKRNSDIRIIVLDDILNRQHECDLFMDYMPFDRKYDKYINKNAKLLLGGKYAILRNEFTAARDKVDRGFLDIKNILIFMGGNDPDNITAFALNGLSSDKYKNLHIKAVVGATCPNIAELKEISIKHENIELIVQANNMADLILWADIGIGSGGVNTWERMCLGLPSVIFELASNQKAVCEYLRAENLAEFVGDISNLDKNLFMKKFDCFISDKELLEKTSVKNLNVIDSNGVIRVAEEICHLIN